MNLPPLGPSSRSTRTIAEQRSPEAVSGAVRVAVIIPALNEEASLPLVLTQIPAGLASFVIVVDNGSTDGTAEAALTSGAHVVRETRKGYGAACLRGIRSLPEDANVVVFLDADNSDFPGEMPEVIRPILEGRADLVIGSRVLGEREPGALLPQARFGNLLACFLIRCGFRHRYTDLGPFRAIRRNALESLEMTDRTFGWTVEMQVKAVKRGLRIVEVPVRYRRRVGRSKITGTLSGTVRAGFKILGTIAREWWRT